MTPRESHAPNCSEDLVIEVTPTEILSYLQLFVKHKQIDIYENYSPRQQIPSRTVTIIAADCRVAVLLKDKCLRSLHHCALIRKQSATCCEGPNRSFGATFILVTPAKTSKNPIKTPLVLLLPRWSCGGQEHPDGVSEGSDNP